MHALWYEVRYGEDQPPSVYVVYAIRTASGWSWALRLAEMITDEVGEDGVRVVVENGVVHVVYHNTEDDNLYYIKM